MAGHFLLQETHFFVEVLGSVMNLEKSCHLLMCGDFLGDPTSCRALSVIRSSFHNWLSPCNVRDPWRGSSDLQARLCQPAKTKSEWYKRTKSSTSRILEGHFLCKNVKAVVNIICRSHDVRTQFYSYIFLLAALFKNVV